MLFTVKTILSQLIVELNLVLYYMYNRIHSQGKQISM
jgi:hypothetical protein